MKEGCNWSLYELRVKIWTTIGTNQAGKRIGLTGYPYYHVRLDTTKLGIHGFKGHKDVCNFEHVFKQVASKKTIPFWYSIDDENPAEGFALLQSAESKKTVLPAAHLFVQRSDQGEREGERHGHGVWMENVTVTTQSSQQYFAELTGATAKAMNGCPIKC